MGQWLLEVLHGLPAWDADGEGYLDDVCEIGEAAPGVCKQVVLGHAPVSLFLVQLPNPGKTLLQHKLLPT